MKIDRIFIKNIGPFDSLDIKLNGESIALVGANSSGKTFLLSSVVDFLYEHLLGFGFDVLPVTGLGHKYFRLTNGNFIKNPNEAGFIWIEGAINDKKLYYLEEYGYSNANEIAPLIGIEANIIPWPKNDEAKCINSLSDTDRQAARNTTRKDAIFSCQLPGLNMIHGEQKVFSKLALSWIVL